MDFADYSKQKFSFQKILKLNRKETVQGNSYTESEPHSTILVRRFRPAYIHGVLVELSGQVGIQQHRTNKYIALILKFSVNT